MIKAKIIGDTTRDSRELLRILVNHPDIIFSEVDLGVGEDKRIPEIFPELTGDTELSTKLLTNEDADVIFVTARPKEALAIINNFSENTPATIDLTDRLFDENSSNSPRALCELWRKALVRGARSATVAPAIEQAVCIALLPFAKNLLLNSPVMVEVNGLPPFGENLRLTADAISAQLKMLQASFKENITISTEEGSTFHQGLSVKVRFHTLIDINDLRDLFDEFYSDHNFVYRLERQPAPEYCLNTNKCFCSIFGREQEAEICCVLDPRIKGGAGTAVHIMNLMFKLHERAGLDIKNSY